MAVASRCSLPLAVVAALALPVVAAAQEAGVATGQVLETGSRAPIVAARVDAIVLPAGRTVASTVTNAAGRYTFPRLAPGSYSLAINRIGYSPKRVDVLLVEAGRTTTADVELEPVASQLDRTTITASRKPEKVLDAPASISVVSEKQVSERPSLTPIDHLRSTPGVDATQGGLTQSNIVARGFNNAFSGALLMLQDNRFAAVPSLRVNIPGLFTSTNEDIDRIEVVLGPGAALYGPNASNGVLHVITKSPFESKGTTFTLDGGERSVMRGALRHAGSVGEKVGFKVSGEYMQGRDWEYRDRAEPVTFPNTPNTPDGRVGARNERDFDVQRYAGEARLDWRPREGTELITNYGYAHIGSSIELTGANGASQIKGWTYQNVQTRLRSGRLFAQAFMNFSDAGNEDADDLGGTFILRTGQPIVDKSRTAALQLQHGFDWGARQTFLYGADYIFTNPRTGNTINGRNEDDDEMTEVGGYVHSVTRLSPKLDFVSALRYDVNSRVEGNFLSPRAALVWKPTELQNVRISYNRAFSTPSNFNLFLDLAQATLRDRGLPVDVIALGVPEGGFTFRRDCATGLGGLCMRSNLPQANDLPAGATPGMVAAVGYQQALAGALAGGLQAALIAQLGQPRANQVIGALIAGNPTAAQAGTILRVLNPSARTPAEAFTLVGTDYVQDVDELKAQFVNNYEAGYKGILGTKLRLAVDGWYQQRRNFITPAMNATPSVFLNGTTTAGFVAQQIGPAIADLPPQNQAAIVTAIATALASVPAGTVVPDNALTNSGNIFFTYRNIEQTISLYGTDVAVDYLLTPRLSLAATYSWVSDVEFPDVPLGPEPLSLNAPDHKGSLTTRWNDEARGYSLEARGRYMNAFTVNSGVFMGRVPVNAFLDAGFSWRLPLADRRMTWGVMAQNLLDNRKNSFIGVPEIGRLVMTRLQYSF